MQDKIDNAAARAAAESIASRDRVGAAWGMEIVDVRAGYARLRMQVRPEMLNGHEIAHGGVIFMFADTALAYAANSRAVSSVTQQASIAYLSQARHGDTLIAEANERALVGRSGVYDVDVRTEDGRVVATLNGLMRAVKS